MERLHGDVVVDGVAAGPVYVIKREKRHSEHLPGTTLAEELKKVQCAISRTLQQLQLLAEQARICGGETAANIFEAHQLILMDDEFTETIHEVLREECVTGEMAIRKTGEKFINMFASMDIQYMRERAADIQDITTQIIQNMSDDETYLISQMKKFGPLILVADHMNPSDIFKIGKEDILAFVVTQGSVTSHAAILARSMNVPALIHVSDLDLDSLNNGDYMIVDAKEGYVVTHPTPEAILEAQEKAEAIKESEKALRKYIGKKSITKDGREIKVYANISDIEETENVNKYAGDGIGLYRSEFLFMGRKSFPTEEEQFQAYRLLLRKMNDKPVIIRTMDIGSDKPLDYFPLAREKNPALGYRGIRVSLKYPEIFKVQLKAIFRAAYYGDLSVMYPLITSTVELDNIQKVIDEAARELEEEKILYRIPKQGIMVETPAAVMISDELAERVDFFSIGTNDLAQYALGIDRQNTDLNMMHNPQHEGIIRMIEMTIAAAHRHGIWAGICGEMAADQTLLKRFVKMGVDEVSVAASQILKVRQTIDEM